MNDKLDPNNLIEGEDYYLTPEGYRCFTEKYHLKRGHCCKSGCRHCPYGFDKKTGEIKKLAASGGLAIRAQPFQADLYIGDPVSIK